MLVSWKVRDRQKAPEDGWTPTTRQDDMDGAIPAGAPSRGFGLAAFGQVVDDSE
jgi:hypothetical protein